MSYLELEQRQTELSNNLNTISNLLVQAETNQQLGSLAGITGGSNVDDLTELQSKLQKELNFVTIKLGQTINTQHKTTRLLQINNYYSELYDDKINILKIVILLCVPIIIASILVSRGMLPQIAYKIIIGFVLIFGLIYLGNQLIVFYSHDNMNYKQLKWKFDTSTAPLINTLYPNGGNPNSIPPTTS
jgi:hypothetical protein